LSHLLFKAVLKATFELSVWWRLVYQWSVEELC